MFKHPPEWTGQIANLTAWFHWEALGAIATVALLFWTIGLAMEGRKERRATQAAALLAASETAGALLSGLRALQTIETEGRGPVSPVAALAALKGWQTEAALVPVDWVGLPNTSFILAMREVQSRARALQLLLESRSVLSPEDWATIGRLEREVAERYGAMIGSRGDIDLRARAARTVTTPWGPLVLRDRPDQPWPATSKPRDAKLGASASHTGCQHVILAGADQDGADAATLANV